MSKTETLETYTNIFYFISGIAGFIASGSVVFLIVMTLLSAGSFIYHQHLTGHIYKFDWVAMVIAILSIAGILFNNYWFWIGATIYITIYSYFLVGKRNVNIEIGISCIPLIIALFIYRPAWVAISIITVFLIALWVKSRDIHKNTRDVHYDSIYHSIWHLITAVGFFIIII